MDPMQNPQHYLKPLDFRCALVVEETDALRISITKFLRKQGWLVHGIKRAEHAFNILAHIPYSVIVIDSDLPGISGIDFVRILHNSSEWRTIQLVVITSTQNAGFSIQIADYGAFLARTSRWEEDLRRFLQGQAFTDSDADAAGSGFARASAADGEPRLIRQIG
jgi:CheY-like chemotaxis protein